MKRQYPLFSWIIIITILTLITILLFIQANVHNVRVAPTITSINYSNTFPLTPTNNILSTQIPLFSKNPTIIVSSTRSPTQTLPIIPTLAEEEARLRILDLLKNNSNCKLPCVWGITPGKSSFSDSYKILGPLAGKLSLFSDFNSDWAEVDLNLNIGELILSTSTSFIADPKTEIIGYAKIDLGAYKSVPDSWNPGHTYLGFVFDSPLFSTKASFYMLDKILYNYGKPSSVLLWTLPEPNEFGEMPLFYLLMIYPDQGFAIHYTTQARKSGSNILGCMTNAHVDLETFPLGLGNQIYKLLPEGFRDVETAGYKPLEEVTSMTIEQYFQTFQKPTDQCIVTPSLNWPAAIR